MNKFLQMLSIKNLRDGVNEFVKTHPEIFCLTLLALACLGFLFYGIGFYPLVDVDETRYAVMARDLINSTDLNSLMLNGVPFLEKPPLYFWMVGASIKFFNTFNPFVVRFPIALISSFLIFFTYYIGKRTISRKFGMYSAFVLISSILFLVLTHVAILDIVLTVFMASALYSAFMTHVCQERNKKYWWFAFYLFVAFGFLAKGLLALAIPAVIVFTYNLITRTLKDIFRPLNLLPGLIVFLAIITPWHVLMYQKYGYLFVKDYFILHHFARFINSETIGRERPIWYFIPVFLLGFMPWALLFVAFLTDVFKKVVARFKRIEGSIKNKMMGLFEMKNNEQKLLAFFLIAFVIIFVIFSSSSTKLPTYILPVFPAASLLMGYFWLQADEKGLYEKAIYNLTTILVSILLIASFGALLVYFFLPEQLKLFICEFIAPDVIMLSLSSIYLIFKKNIKNSMAIFSGYIFAMLLVIVLAVTQIFNFMYNTGQVELVRYSMYGAHNQKAKLVTFDFAVKYSVMVNYTDKVDFITDADFEALDKVLKYKDGPVFVIVKNKNFKDNEKYLKKLKRRMRLVNAGERYSLYADNY